MKTNMRFLPHLAKLFLQWETFQTKVVDKSKHTFVFNNGGFFLKKIVHLKIIWKKNIAESGRPQMTVWCMRVACWIPKATNTHSKYVIIIAFTLQQWLHEHISMCNTSFV